MRRPVSPKAITAAVVFTVLVAGCTAGTERASEAPAEDGARPDTNAPADTSSQNASAPAPDALSEADARRVLRAVYRPIHTFYQRLDTSGTNERPPAGMRTPQALVNTLTQTMAPDLARAFADQLLMQRGDGYIVRPTEKILIPYGRPALESVSIAREDGRYVITERYAKDELYGRVERRNVVRWAEGRWRLVDIRH